MIAKCPRQRKGIIWITDLALDRDVHRTSRIEILRHLAELDYETTLFAIRSKGRCPYNSAVRISCVPLAYLPVVQPILFSMLLLILLPVYALLRKPKYIITSPGPSVLVFLWKPLLSTCLKSKILLDIRSTPVESGWIGELQEFIFDLSVMVAKSLFDGMTIITTEMRDEVARRFNLNPELFGVWTSGVSTQIFEPNRYSDEETARLKAENNLTGKFVVFHHGGLGMRRGIIETVESIEIVKKRCDDVVLFILGSGPALPQIRRLIRDKGLDGRVIVHDVVDYEEVPKYIAMSDVGIVPLPNIPEWVHQCPLKLLEYLAMAKPAIITDIPANRSIVGDSECGIYAQSASKEEIARAIIHARAMRSMLRRWGALGRAIVQEKYDWRIVAQRFDRYLTDL